MDPRGTEQDQADAGRPAGDGGASRRVDEVLGREHKEQPPHPVMRKRGESQYFPATMATPVSPAALSLRHITRRFGDFVAVDDVSLDVAPGELVALIGASGSGKTTTLRMVAGYESPDAGEILLGDRDI